eukprot:scaffold206626_cov27-Tisochrysis_lutea.AAC.1
MTAACIAAASSRKSSGSKSHSNTSPTSALINSWLFRQRRESKHTSKATTPGATFLSNHFAASEAGSFEKCRREALPWPGNRPVAAHVSHCKFWHMSQRLSDEEETRRNTFSFARAHRWASSLSTPPQRPPSSPVQGHGSPSIAPV